MFYINSGWKLFNCEDLLRVRRACVVTIFSVRRYFAQSSSVVNMAGLCVTCGSGHDCKSDFALVVLFLGFFLIEM